ncbi:MAG: nitrile hydratase subunit alpha [Pseudomonadota bacterium]
MDERQPAPGHGHRDHAGLAETGGPRAEYLLLERAVRELLIDKGLFAADDLRRQIDLMDSRSPALGARLVARAWVDPAFKRRLIADAKAAAAELGIDVSGMPALVVLENTDDRHHVVVCTLCSCYPKAILGVPPAWYKSAEYRSRAAVDPRSVLREFGTELAPDVEVRVADSTADMRYLVLPRRPPASEGMSEAELAKLVTRDSMIGLAHPLAPAPIED